MIYVFVDRYEAIIWAQSVQGQGLSLTMQFNVRLQQPITYFRGGKEKTLLLILHIDIPLLSSLSGSCLKRIFLLMIFFFPIISTLSYPLQNIQNPQFENVY